jgi:hypothetical protein
MPIEMDVRPQPEPGNTLEKGCLNCPHKFRFERNAGCFRINREIAQHRAICPGRKRQPVAVGRARIKLLRRSKPRINRLVNKPIAA